MYEPFSRHGPRKEAVLFSPSLLQPDNSVDKRGAGCRGVFHPAQWEKVIFRKKGGRGWGLTHGHDYRLELDMATWAFLKILKLTCNMGTLVTYDTPFYS